MSEAIRLLGGMVDARRRQIREMPEPVGVKLAAEWERLMIEIAVLEQARTAILTSKPLMGKN